MPGTDLLPWAGEFDALVDEIEEFVTGDRPARGHPPALDRPLHRHRGLDGPGRRLGDSQWRGVLDEFDVNVRRLLERHDGAW